MNKQLEDRIEELEKEVAIIKALGSVILDNRQINSSESFERNLENITSDFNITLDDYEFMESSTKYPEIIGSWDEFDFDRVSKDLVSFNQTDVILPHEGCENVVSEYFCESEKRVEKQFGKIISKFKILHHQWEMDGYGYIIQTEEGKKIVTTDHGKPVIVDKDFLEIKISEYKEAIQETQRVLFLIK